MWWQSLRKHITPAILVTGGVAVLGIVVPFTGWISAGWARITTICAILVIVIGVLLVIKNERQLKTNGKTHLGIKDIVPILQKMDLRLTELIPKIAKKYFSVPKYITLNQQINDVIGLVPKKSTNIEDIRKETLKLEKRVQKQKLALEKDGNFDLDSLLPNLKTISGLMESKGYGLKQVRENDKRYTNLKSDLLSCRNLIDDAQLNKLIYQHIEYSEMFANLVLNIRRTKRLWTLVNMNIVHTTDLIPINTQSNIESFEQISQESLIQKRMEITNRIKELEVDIGKR